VKFQLRGSSEEGEDDHGRDRGVRGSIGISTVGRQRPRLETSKAARPEARALECCMTIRRSGLGQRETSGPPIMPYGALVSVGRPRRESGESESGTHAVRVHAVRLGGRHRLDASRAFSTERSARLLGDRGR